MPRENYLKPHLLYRPLDVQEHPDASLNLVRTGTYETYQNDQGQHLWTIKRFHGLQVETDPTDANPEEVEKEHHEP